jgi:uncharacterized MnhB-related membrane protein
MVPLQLVTILFVALGAAGVALARDLVRQAILFSIYGFGLVLLFFVFLAPDVALSALVVMTVAYPLVVLVAVARVRSRKKDDE